MACPGYIRRRSPPASYPRLETGNACWTKKPYIIFHLSYFIFLSFFLHSPRLCGLLFSCLTIHIRVILWKLTVQWSIDSHKESEACKFMYVIRFWWLFPCLGFHVIILWRKLRLRWWKPNTHRIQVVSIVLVWVSFAVFFLHIFSLSSVWKRDRKQFIYSVVVGCISTEHYMDFLGRRQLKCLCTCKAAPVRPAAHTVTASSRNCDCQEQEASWRDVLAAMEEYDVSETFHCVEEGKNLLRKVILIKP